MLKDTTSYHLLENLAINMKKKKKGFCNKSRNRCCKNCFQKSAEATGDLIENKIADKITLLGKSKEKEKTKKVEEIYIPPEKNNKLLMT